jgi:cell division septation protein DedD
VLTDADDATRLLRLRPPNDAIADSATLPRAGPATLAPVGDRAYLVSGMELFGIAPNELERREHYRTESDIVAIAPTPSGDRVFVATQGTAGLHVVDRYAAQMKPSVLLPGAVSDLRMDPLGRYVLAKSETGDSAWIVSISDAAIVGTIATTWREDLPTVVLDGTIATLHGNDLAFVDPRSGKTVRTADGGADHLWFFVRWNGFRPRAQGIDEPVSFSYDRGDTAVPPLDSAAVLPRSAADSLPPPVVVERPAAPEPVAPRSRGWTVSFAAVLSLERAREIAATISVDGSRPRVVTGETAGTTVYRVVLGPFETREAADRVGRSSRHSYWIFEDVP